MTTLADMAGDTPGPDPTEPCGTEAAIRRHTRENAKRRRQGLDPIPLDDACRKERNRLAQIYYHQRKKAGEQ